MQVYVYIYVYIPKYLVNKSMCYFSSNEIQMNSCLEKEIRLKYLMKEYACLFHIFTFN